MKKIIFLAFMFSPALAFADGFSNFGEVVNYILGFINLLLPLFGGLALLVFILGLVKFISKSGDSGSHKDGKDLMVYGLLALFIMISFLGIITIGEKDLGFTPSNGLPIIKR
ncbi:MAG: seg [Parcubacteria group bacterium]|nr:seg [Parcubacteria group bacterium]